MKRFLRDSKGSITVYTLVSMAFFLTVSIGIHTNTNNKVQEQDTQIEQIQESYEKQDDINSIYEQTYEKIKHIKTPTINMYGEDNLIASVVGDKVNKIKTVYTNYDNVTLKFTSSLSGYEYAYSTTRDGEKIVGDTVNIKVTEDGTTMYSYLKEVSTGEYFDKYTAIVIKLTSLNDKEIYLAEGTSKEIKVTGNKNIGNITYSDISDLEIASVTDNKILNGLKAGTATIKATESNGGATAVVTAKVTKIEVENQKGTMLLNSSKILEVSGINHGALDVELSDSSIATVSVQGSTLNIKANKVGKTIITITELNGGATTSYELNVANVSLSPDGGNYLLPTDGTNAIIKTTVTAENEEKIEYYWETESGGQETWTEIENGTTLEKLDCIGNKEYYLYIRINEQLIYKSNPFIINATTNKITIKPDKDGWTNQDIACTITYPEESVNSTRKSAYGSSLQSATINSNSAIAPTTSVKVTENGYVYAQATDIAGNKVTSSLQIKNIDKLKPKITVNPTSSTASKMINLTITAVDEGESGLNSSNSYQYQLGTSNTTAPTGTWSVYTNGTQVTIGTNLTGTYYLWVKEVSDNTGNISSADGTKVETYHVFGSYVFDNIAPTISSINVTNPAAGTYKAGQEVTIVATYNDNIYGNASKAAVTSSTAPVLKIKFGNSAERTATFKSVSGKTITYTYTIASGDNGTLATTGYSGTVYDIVGNSLSVSNKTIGGNAIIADTTAPTKPTLTNSSSGNWTNAGVTISVYSDDSGSGVEKLQYSYDKSTWNDDWGTLTINGTRTSTSGTWTAQRNNTLYARAIDKVGNISEISTTVIKIDKTAPICSVSSSTTNWTNADVTLTGVSQDALSGLIAFAWTSSATEPSGTTTTGELGKWTTITNTKEQISKTMALSVNATRYFWIKDEAGNVNSASITISKIDKSVPNTFTPTATSTINTITVTASTTDKDATTSYGKSGIAGYRYRINSGTWSSYQTSGTYTFTGLSQATSYKVEVEAKDNAGNTTVGTVTISTKQVTIGLSATSGYVKVGATKQITASGSNYGSVSVSSSNTNVATVSVSGTTITITGKAAGTATITATAANNTSKKATYTIYVTSLAAPSTTSHTLEIGGTVTLAAPTASTYAGTVTYTSSNTAVATVTSSRVVKAVAGGTATITAKEANGGATVTYTIKVNKNQLLANVVSKGQYVNYPINYTNVDSFCGQKSTLTGWRVLYTSGGCVYLVSAGSPINDANKWGISTLYTYLTTTSNFSSYINSTYAEGARSLNKADINSYLVTTSVNTTTTYSDTLIKNGGMYWLADYYDSTKQKLWMFQYEKFYGFTPRTSGSASERNRN